LHHGNDGQPERHAGLEQLNNAGQPRAVLCCRFRHYARIAALYSNGVAEQLIDAGIQHLQSTCPRAARLLRIDAATVVVVVDNDHDNDEIEQLAHRCAAHWPLTDQGGRPPLLLTLAIGVACSESGAEPSIEQMLNRADLACQLAEQRPGDQVVMASPDLNACLRSQYEQEASLHRALEHGELTAHLQPIVDLATGTPIGFECLARWQQRDGAVIGPGDFLKQAVDSGISADVDLQTLATALKAAPQLAAAYGGSGALLLSANISAQLVENPHKVEALLHLLEEHLHTIPIRLQLELIEEALHDNNSDIDDLLDALSRLGVLIAIDDFGTGYSSLSRVHNLAINSIKIDRSFVQRLDDPHKPSNHLLETMIAIGHDLKVKLTAEGVETETQRQWLKNHGCAQGQGFLFSQPLSLEDAVRYLRATS